MPQTNPVIPILAVEEHEEPILPEGSDWADEIATTLMAEVGQQHLAGNPVPVLPLIAEALRTQYERGRQDYVVWKHNAIGIMDVEWQKTHENPSAYETFAELAKQQAKQQDLLETMTKKKLQAETFGSKLLSLVEPMETQLKAFSVALKALVDGHDNRLPGPSMNNLWLKARKLATDTKLTTIGK
jgi:hypothetical protein